jgi:catechol 2,3-dioxygenase-like lactoylglutathione lyase family enzyme
MVMAFHHVAIAVKDPRRAHTFYTEAMGFRLVKIVKRQSPEGGWTKHIFYDTGNGGLFAIWDLRGVEGVVVEKDGWRGGMSTGTGLPYWVNHLAFDCKDIGGLERAKQRWLDHGYHVSEIKHEFIHSIYTRDPDGTLVEFTYDTQALGQADIDEAYELLADDSPSTVPDYEAVVHKSPHYKARKEAERARDADQVDPHSGSAI